MVVVVEPCLEERRSELAPVKASVVDGADGTDVQAGSLAAGHCPSATTVHNPSS
jgi:hypothetical protein